MIAAPIGEIPKNTRGVSSFAAAYAFAIPASTPSLSTGSVDRPMAVHSSR